MDEVTRPMLLMVDGVVVDPAARTLVLDDGLVRGDAVFEGLRAYGGRLRTPELHLDRLERSAATIRMPLDRALVTTELAELESRLGPDDVGVRIIVTRNGQRVLREEPLPAIPAPWTLAPVAHRITPLLAASKTVSYAANMQANRIAADAGADQALFVRADDEAVLEGPTFSVGWIVGEELRFPPLAHGILDSITRRLVFACVEGVREVDARVGDLAEAEGMLVVSTVTESVPVGRLVGVGAYDPDGRRLTEIRAALAEHVRASLGVGAAA
jgi:branched-subunit amino acid aminotransferase/4-amino-4-deoxychorismate lyase